jgi:hypothetical protein
MKGEKKTSALLKTLSRNMLQGRKKLRTLFYVSQCPGQDLNPGRLENEARMLLNWTVFPTLTF